MLLTPGLMRVLGALFASVPRNFCSLVHFHNQSLLKTSSMKLRYLTEQTASYPMVLPDVSIHAPPWQRTHSDNRVNNRIRKPSDGVSSKFALFNTAIAESNTRARMEFRYNKRHHKIVLFYRDRDESSLSPSYSSKFPWLSNWIWDTGTRRSRTVRLKTSTLPFAPHSSYKWTAVS